MNHYQPEFPIAISQVQGKYLLFDIEVVTWLRRNHQLVGAFVGTLPQSPSQNVFLGLPLEIIPEEAQLLVEKGVACIVDDARAHDGVVKTISGAKSAVNQARRTDYLRLLAQQADHFSKVKAEQKLQERKQKIKLAAAKSKRKTAGAEGVSAASSAEAASNQDSLEDSLFAVDGNSSASTLTPVPARGEESGNPILQHLVTPTSSSSLLEAPPSPSQGEQTMNLPSSYPLYRHLNSKGYFMTPGLRFGCQYCVYPGDPLRFHSHFLAVGTRWDEELDLMDILAGGRLGTGVKKGFLIGGESPDEEMKTFSIEWAAM